MPAARSGRSQGCAAGETARPTHLLGDPVRRGIRKPGMARRAPLSRLRCGCLWVGHRAMDDRDEKARARDDAGDKRDVAAAIRDKLGDDSEREARHEAGRDRWAAAEDRRAAAKDRIDPDEQA